MLFFFPKPLRRLIYLAVLLGILAVGDVFVRTWAEGQLEARIEERLQRQGGVDVTLEGFPFVGRLLAFGEVEGLQVRLDEVARQGLTFATIGVDLQGIALDRQAFISDRKVQLEDLDSGGAFAEITQEELSRVLGATVTLQPGRATVKAAGRTATASVTIRDGRVVLIPDGLPPLSVAIPKHAFLPCAAKGTVLQGRLRVSCSVTTIPGPLVEAASKAANG